MQTKRGVIIMKNNPRAALYIRVSTEEQARHGYSVGEQEHDLTEYALKKGYEIFGVYADEGLSARKAISRRKALQQLLDDVQSGLIDVIVIKCLDRWFRSVRDFYRVQDILDRHDVTWECTQEDYNTATTNGRLMLNLKLSIAQHESDQTGDRVRYINEGKKRRREVLSARAPIGYRIENKHLIRDEKTAPIIVAVFNYFAANPNLYATMRYLSDEYKMIRAYEGVRKILKNRTYIGERYGDPEYNEAIIDKEIFNTVQTLLQRHRSPQRTSRIYLFTGLLRCPHCGCTLAIQGRTKGGKTYNYYRCSLSFRNTTCKSRFYVSESYLEKYLLRIFQSELSSFISRDPKKDRESIYSGRISNIREKIKRLKDLYIHNMISRDEYARDYRAFHTQLENVMTSLAIVKRPVRPSLLTLEKKNIAEIYNNFSHAERKEFWHNFIDRIEFDKAGHPHIFFR